MKTIRTIFTTCALVMLCGTAFATEPAAKGEACEATQTFDKTHRDCSIRDIVGKWLFATEIGRQMLPGFPPDKDVTALGTMVIRRDGTLTGVFDVTVQDSFFVPGVGYEGAVVINPDCTGTLMFVTGVGTVRTDSIALVGRSEFLGMSQDPANLWTYQGRRVGSMEQRDY